MKSSLSQVLALGGLCALFVSTGNAVFAQDTDHQDRNGDPAQSRSFDRHDDQHQNDRNRQYGQQYHQGQYNHDSNDYGRGRDDQYRQSSQYRHANQNERRRLDRLHAAYAHAAASGNYNAAERAHEHAQAIRARLRSQHQDANRRGDTDQDRRGNN